MSFTFTGKAAFVAAIVTIVFVILIAQNPNILSWILSALYSGPR